MSDYHIAVDTLNLSIGDPDRQEEALALFSTHTNLSMALGLLTEYVNKDNIEGIDKAMDLLSILVERHRKGHHPGQAPPRHQHEGTVESGNLVTSDPIRIETERFNLWLYPGPDPGQVRIETEAR